MNFFSKIKVKFQNLLPFNEMNPIKNFDFDEENIDEREYKDNIVLFQKEVENHSELKEILWIGIYHCLNTFKFENECLTVLNNNFELIVDLLPGDDRMVSVPNFVKKEYKKGNILATFHNHFEGAIIPSINDFNNSILPKLKFTVITSKNLIGIIINDNYELNPKIFQRLINDFKLFEVYLNFCFSNDEFDKIKLLENSFEGEEFKRQREFLFDNYVAQNIERFVVEFNSRMEKFNVYFLYNKIIGRILICLMN